jgi:hypothetical protein
LWQKNIFDNFPAKLCGNKKKNLTLVPPFDTTETDRKWLLTQSQIRRCQKCRVILELLTPFFFL